MDDAVLDFRLGIDRLDRRRKTGQIIRTGNENILDAPIFQAVQYGSSEFRTFVLADPHSQNILPTIKINTDGDIDGLLYDLAFAADMVVNRIQKNNRINGLQRPLLPLFRYGKDFICDTAYRGIRDIYTVDVLNMRFNVTGGHAFGVHGQNLLLDVLADAGLIFPQHLGVKFALAIPRHRYLYIAKTGAQGFAAVPVPAVIRVLVLAIIPS